MLMDTAAAQQKQLAIHCAAPKQVRSGNKINLKVSVTHQLTTEQTGNITLELLDNKNKSVDGWFLNIFPFQYFTSIAHQTFETSFPFTVPSNFKGTFKLIVKAACGAAKDSAMYMIDVSAKNKMHD